MSTRTQSQFPCVGVAVLIFKDGNFLMAKRKGSHGSGTWSVPGGHLDFGESPRSAVEREVLEEVGVKIRNIKLFEITNDIFDAEGKHYITLWYCAEWVSGEFRILEPEKCSELGWNSLYNLPHPLFEPCWSNLLKVGPAQLDEKMANSHLLPSAV